jgi:hypothetical protein
LQNAHDSPRAANGVPASRLRDFVKALRSRAWDAR